MKLGPPPSPNRKEFPFVGSLVFQGIPIDIENAKGDVRTGVDKDGHRWRSVMHAHYGEFRNGVRGEDGDKIDVYVGPDESSGVVVIVNQNDPVTGKHDEQKCLVGFATADDALALYDRQYDRDGFRGTHVVMTVDDLKRKIVDKRNDGKALAKAMAVYASMYKIHGGGFKAEFDPWDRHCLSALSAESARRLNARVHLTKSLTRSKERGNIDSLSNSASTSLMRSAMLAANTWPSVSAVACESADSTTDATASASTSLAKAMAAWISDTEASPLAVSSARMNLRASSILLDDEMHPPASLSFSGKATSSLMQETLPNTISKHNVSRGGRSMSRLSITKACADFFSALTPQDATAVDVTTKAQRRWDRMLERRGEQTMTDEELAQYNGHRKQLADVPLQTQPIDQSVSNGEQERPYSSVLDRDNADQMPSNSFQDENGDWWVPMDTALAEMMLMFGLAKGRSHKYIKRVPTGAPKGKPQWRYYYKNTATAKGVPHAMEHIKTGMSFADGKHGGHWHVVEREPGRHVKIRHDETGEERSFHVDPTAIDPTPVEHKVSNFIHSLHASDIDAATREKQVRMAMAETTKANYGDIGASGEDLLRHIESLAASLDPSTTDGYALKDDAQRLRKDWEATAGKFRPKAESSTKTSELRYAEKSSGKGAGPNAGEIFYDATTKKHYVALKKKTERLSRRDQEAAEDNGDYDTVAYHNVTVRPASEDEARKFDEWKSKRDTAQEFIKNNEFKTTSGVKELLAKPEYSKPDEKAQRKGEKIEVKPADKWGRQWSNAYIDKDGGRIELESNHDSYDDYRGESVYVAPYSDELAAAVRDAGSGHAAKLAEAKRDSMAPRPTVDIPKDVPPKERSEPVIKEKSPDPKVKTSKTITEAPKLGYRKTREGDWAVFGPAHALKPGAMHEVQTKAGDVRTEHVKRVSRPFDIGGVPHAYGYLKAGTIPPPGEAFASMWKAS